MVASAEARKFYATFSAAVKAVPPYRSPVLAKTPEEHEAALAHEDARNAALYDLKATIEAHGGKVEDRWDGARVRIFGLRATSTTGLEGACRNWMTQFTLKSAMAGAA
jgi:hypothetical protein